MNADEFEALVRWLVSQPGESEWLEFKRDNTDPDMIAKNVSALSNTLCLGDRDCAYMVWGVEDGSRFIMGTSFEPNSAQKGGQALELCLSTSLRPAPPMRFIAGFVGGARIVVLEVRRPTHSPVDFRGRRYVRLGANTVDIGLRTGAEAAVFASMITASPDHRSLAPRLTALQVEERLHLPTYAKLAALGSAAAPAIVDELVTDRLLACADSGMFSVSMSGALLLARDLTSFGDTAPRIIRLAEYPGGSRADPAATTDFNGGYATELEVVIRRATTRYGSVEDLSSAIRIQREVFDPASVREALVNALLHQDLAERGTSILVETFFDRIEITNPGRPIVDIERLVNAPPRSRNEFLTGVGRRLGLCESRGTGWDKMVRSAELLGAPAPRMVANDYATTVSLFAPKHFSMLTQAERLDAVYMHACLQHAEGKPTTNSSLRHRFQLGDAYVAQVSRLIAAAVSAGRIRSQSESPARKSASYIPYGA